MPRLLSPPVSLLLSSISCAYLPSSHVTAIWLIDTFIPVALLRSSNVPHVEPDRRWFYYFVAYWLHHASNVTTETKKTNAETPSKLSAAALRFFRDNHAFQSWAATVSGKYIDRRYMAPKSEPLHIAAAYGLLGTTALLVNEGNSISAADYMGRTPLYWASARGYEGVARLLIDKGADVSPANNGGETPLHAASGWGHEGVVRLLIDKGADASVAKNNGETQLHLASMEGHEGVVRLLVDKGADVSVAKNNGETPLHLASMEGHEGWYGCLLARALMSQQPAVMGKHHCTGPPWWAMRGWSGY